MEKFYGFDLGDAESAVTRLEKNKDTGETSLKIPVPDKDTVVQVLGLLGKLFQGK